jgi:hypothetical protein
VNYQFAEQKQRQVGELRSMFWRTGGPRSEASEAVD